MIKKPSNNDLIMHISNHIFNFSERTYIMGILNVTPDSFSDGGDFYEKKIAVERAIEMQNEGADIIDIGGESTRPGADEVTFEEELDRVIPVIEKLKSKIRIPISIDTYKSHVAEKAVKAGASIINDISGLRFDPKIAVIAAKYNIPVIIMHIKGSPKNMQKNPEYDDLIKDIYDYLNDSIQIAIRAGIPRNKIIIDPGIGFGKKYNDNFVIINKLKYFSSLKCPILIGVSRKSFIGNVLNAPEKHRVIGTAAAVTASIINGANMIRVHDVKEMVQTAKIADKFKAN